MGDLLMTQPYLLTGTLPTPSTRKRLPLRLRSNGDMGSQSAQYINPPGGADHLPLHSYADRK
jgi:hypothetical protein